MSSSEFLLTPRSAAACSAESLLVIFTSFSDNLMTPWHKSIHVRVRISASLTVLSLERVKLTVGSFFKGAISRLRPDYRHKFTKCGSIFSTLNSSKLSGKEHVLGRFGGVTSWVSSKSASRVTPVDYTSGIGWLMSGHGEPLFYPIYSSLTGGCSVLTGIVGRGKLTCATGRKTPCVELIWVILTGHA